LLTELEISEIMVLPDGEIYVMRLPRNSAKFLMHFI